MDEKKKKQYVSDNTHLIAELDWDKNSILGIDPTKLTIYQKDDNYEIKNGPNTQLLLQVKIEGPKEYDPRVTWKVSDETIATIDERGVLVPKKSGKVTVTVTSIIDNNVTGKVAITIK